MLALFMSPGEDLEQFLPNSYWLAFVTDLPLSLIADKI
jgi:hypothetical protein